MENVDALYLCPSVEEIARRVDAGSGTNAHPQGVFRFKDFEAMNRADVIASQRWTEYMLWKARY
jgi:hypothetical protein